MRYTIEELSRMIDHTYVKAFASESDMKKLCDEAKEYHFAMAAINSCQSEFVSKQLAGSDIHTGAAISFPLGQTTIEVKLFEIEDAISHGADEIDYVVNLTKVKEKDWDYVQEEMQRITELCHAHDKIIKVILETNYLEQFEIEKLCEISVVVKPDFVKTSTGFSPVGATIENIQLMKSICKDVVQVKASGGIRDANTFKSMIQAGATRIGTSAGVSIIEELKKEAIDGSIEI